MNKVKRVLNTVIFVESAALITFIPQVDKAIVTINNSAQSFLVVANNIITNMYNAATGYSFGYSNLWFIALFFVAIGLPILDIILKPKEGQQ